MGELLPIHTPRLTVRMMTIDDAAVLAAYRNDPQVAAHQLWDLPYTREQAEAMLSTQAADEQMVPGGRYQLAIEVDGVVVGDVFTGIDPAGGVAEIGYSLATEHQGRGYATEAAAAVVAALFDEFAAERVYGELDPVNVASQRVLERIGLVFEGVTRRSFRWRDEWTDNMSYAATAEEFEQWRSRPRHRPEDVRLVELDADNHRAYVALRTHHSEERFVDPNWRSMIDALFPPVVGGAPLRPWLGGIEADGEAVGFVMLAEPTTHHPEPVLWRLMIDRRHQRRGIGRRAVELIVERLRSEGLTSLVTRWADGRGGPRRFYERLGFVPTGEVVDGETEVRLRW